MRIQFRVASDDIQNKLREWVGPRGELSPGARQLLERYFALIERELREVALSEAEAALVADALNGTLIEPHTATLMWAEVAEAIRLDALDRKWDVDGEALVAKLRGMCPGKLFAIAHAVEAFWRNHSGENPSDALRTVGLVRDRSGATTLG